MSDKQVQFLPFTAINEFMLDDYRQQVLRTVLAGMNQLSPRQKSALAGQIKRHVQVPGFRNSAQAPAALKLRGAVTAFQRQPDFVAETLQAWSELNPELRRQVYDLLVQRGWEVLPADADRTGLPGFMVNWPAEETYDALDAAYAEMYPDSQAAENDVRLMVVWVGDKLPYNVTQEEGEE